MRSTKSYILKFVLGTEIFYFLCLLYGALLTGSAAQLHRELFAVAVPGFIWGSIASIIWGAILWAIFGGLIAWFINWMHNSSLVENKLMSYAYQRKVALSFQEAINKTKDSLTKEGFGVLTEIDVQVTLKKKLDVDYNNYVILGACNPPFAYRSLQAEKEIGLLLPCNVIIYEEHGQVFVSTILPTVAMGMIKNPALAKIAEEIETKLKRALDFLGTN